MFCEFVRCRSPGIRIMLHHLIGKAEVVHPNFLISLWFNYLTEVPYLPMVRNTFLKTENLNSDRGGLR